MKKNLLAALVILAAVTGCTTKLSDSDRALLTETRSLAERAVAQSSAAMNEARAARESAEKAALDAASSGKRAEKIFRETQQK